MTLSPRRALAVLVVASGLLRLAWAAGLGPGNDEAYHYLFTVHRDWSYFDHPPMLALVASLGTCLAGRSVVGLRIGFVLLFAGSTWLMARLTSRFYGERAGLLAAFGLNVTAYYTAAASVFALPDGPLLFFWLLTLDRLAAAFDAPEGRDTRAWLGVGLAWGGALLSKYHAVFLPAGALLYVLVEPTARRALRRPGPYLSALVGLAVFSPVIFWNAGHAWASFAFQGGRALGGARLRVDTLVAALALPALYLLPWVWFRLVGVLFGRLRRFFDPGLPAGDRFLLCQAVTPLAMFLAVACTRPVLPHWTLVGFLPVFPMLGRAWDAAFSKDPARFRRRAAWLAAMPVLLAGLALFQARTGFFQKGRPGGIGLVSALGDPTADLVGWDVVADEIQRRGLLDRPDTFLFTEYWYQSGQLGFATRGLPNPVLCYHPWDARSFAFWDRPADFVGREGVLVTVNDSAGTTGSFGGWFERVEPLATIPITRAGATLRTVRLYRCVRQTRAFPFDDLGRSLRPKNRPPADVAAGPAGARH